jgi:hypothetical protein
MWLWLPKDVPMLGSVLQSPHLSTRIIPFSNTIYRLKLPRETLLPSLHIPHKHYVLLRASAEGLSIQTTARDENCQFFTRKILIN